MIRIKFMTRQENYCNPRKNKVFGSHRVGNTNMDDYASFEHFLTELRKRVESCNFNGKNRMLQDKIVFSTSSKLQELLLREEKLEMGKCIQLFRAYEQSNKQVREIKEKKEPIKKITNPNKESNINTNM